MIPFTPECFIEPDAVYWPGYFWLWNGPLVPDELLRQLRDMYAHGARSVCTLPMPHEFRPDSTNNRMDVPYLSAAFFDRIACVVEEAARLGMHFWLYDEGGWPSGEACGQVTKDHPELRASILRLHEDGTWQLEHTDSVDRLNPQATQRFLELTHDGYWQAVGDAFGKTIRIAFTDEPNAGQVVPGHSLPWTAGLGETFAQRFGYRIEDHLDTFAKEPDALTRDDMRVRVDFFDHWSQRFVDAYFLPIRRWCHAHGILAGGHLGGEDETLGSVLHGFGHVLRTLRAQDVPGVDVIWRQLLPGQANHHFPLYAATVAHQLGQPYAFTESFAVYGNGLTPAQMKWVTDYQYVRGINLMVGACYPFSTQDHQMGGERPHFGPVNPLWDYLPCYHAYTARLGYALSCGQPAIDTALYLPVRDMWAHGLREQAVEGYEALVQALEARQCAFDLIDDDVLAGEIRIEDGCCRVGPMAYRQIVLGPCAWLTAAAAETLAAFVRAGGELICLNRLPGVDGDAGDRFRACLGDEVARVPVLHATAEIADLLPSLVQLDPPGDSMRVMARTVEHGAIYFLWNEGETAYAGRVRFPKAGAIQEMLPENGSIIPLVAECTAELDLCLEPGESRLLLCGETADETPRAWQVSDTVALDAGWQARALREYVIGAHDYEIHESADAWQPIALGPWKDRFTEDFSGDVAYRVSIPLRQDWQGLAARVKLGDVEYVAEVRIDGVSAGKRIWPPWEIILPEGICSGTLELEVVVTNTLANQLTSERVRNDWAQRTGPGWPGVYDARAAVFEMDSRGGGLYGPVTLEIGRFGD